MEFIRKMKENKTACIIFKAIKIFFIVLMIGFAFVICLQRFSNNKMSFFNYRIFTVVSGSMAPKYNIHDVLISKEISPSKIKVGDTISYLGKAGDFKNKVITHQVVNIGKAPDGRYYFRAKGLANLIEDPIVYEDQLYGVVIYKSLLLSFIYRIVASNLGFYLLIILPIIFVVGYEIVMLLLDKEDKKRRNN